MTFGIENWTELLSDIRQGMVTPFLGAGAAAPFIPLAKDLANMLAEKYSYPFKEHSDNLSKVAEFVGIIKNDPKTEICNLISKVNPPDFTKYKNTPYPILADLPLPIYITTNYDHFLEEALKSRGKTPVSEFCAWNDELKEYIEYREVPSIFKGTFNPTSSNPLVFHLHGDIDEPKSIVLTHQDYIYFLKNYFDEGDNFLSPVIRKQLAWGNLLFIGYSLQDNNVQLMLGLNKSLMKSNLVVFPSVSSYSIDTNKLDKFKPYIELNFKTKFNTKIFWGTAEEFTSELRNRLEKYSRQPDETIKTTNGHSKKIWYTSDGKPI